MVLTDSAMRLLPGPAHQTTTPDAPSWLDLLTWIPPTQSHLVTPSLFTHTIKSH